MLSHVTANDVSILYKGLNRNKADPVRAIVPSVSGHIHVVLFSIDLRLPFSM